MADSAEGLTTATEQLKINGNSNGNSNGDGASKSDILSSRGLVLAGGGEQVAKFKQLLGNPWDPKTNPGGIVNIGTAENVQLHQESDYICCTDSFVGEILEQLDVRSS